jgi:hypothetical protein
VEPVDAERIAFVVFLVRNSASLRYIYNMKSYSLKLASENFVIFVYFSHGPVVNMLVIQTNNMYLAAGYKSVSIYF